MSCLAGLVFPSLALAVDTAPAFTTQPVNRTVLVGQTAAFTVAATGTPAPTRQWQRSNDGGATWANLAGATGTGYTTAATVLGDTGACFRCVASNVAGTATSAVATLTVNKAPSFTTQPVNTSVVPGQSATFTVVAAGQPAPAYQWQRSNDGGATWANVAGATAASHVTAPTGSGDHNARYRCVATNVAGSATSTAVILTVYTPPAFTTQPVNRTVLVGQAAAFTVAATGNPAPTRQWQRSNDGGVTWANLAGATGTGYTTAATVLGDTGARFRCVASNVAGATTSAVATLTVNKAPAFTTQPVAKSVFAGQAAGFNVVATGQPAPTLQWQRSNDNGVTWANLADATAAGYVTAATVAGDHNARFRCQATNVAGSATSTAVILTVYSAPVFTTQPASPVVIVGQRAAFTVAASGNPAPAWQWQRSNDGGLTWANLAGATGAGYTTAVTVLGDTGARFRCQATNAAGVTLSAAATLTVNVPPAFKVQPLDNEVYAGWSATFTVEATGVPAPALQWQRSNDGGATWAEVIGATAANYTTAGLAHGDDGARFRCLATNAAGVVASAVVTLTVPAGDAPVLGAGVVHVNAGWVGLPAGQDPDGAGPATAMGQDAFVKVQQGINAASDGAVVRIAAGVYPENLVVTRSVTLQGPAADPVHGLAPRAVLRPLARSSAFVEVGDTTDQAACTPQLVMNNIKIDGSGVETVLAFPNTGVNLHKGACLRMSKCHVFYIRFLWIGYQAGWGLSTKGASADVEDCLFSDFGKGAVQCFENGTVNLRRNVFRGPDLGSTYQMAVDGVVYHGQVGGEIVGNLFQDFDPSGKYNAIAGGALVADDLAVGCTLLLDSYVADPAALVVRDNTFDAVQAAFADWRIMKGGACRPAAITAERFFAANNQMAGGRYLVLGAMNEGTYIFGDRPEDPNLLNYVLRLFTPAHNSRSFWGLYERNVVTLPAGAEYRLGHDLVGSEVPVTLESAGASTLILPNRAAAAGVSFAPSVTVRYLPAVDIVKPAKQVQIPAGVAVPVEVTVRDLDGSGPAAVTLYDGPTVLHSWSAAPYTCTLPSLSEGFHNLSAVAVDDTGLEAASEITPVVVGAAPSSIYWELWKDIPVAGWSLSVADLLLLDRFPLSPDQQAMKDVFEGPQDSVARYGTRLRGYVVAPVTGAYTFWITADDAGELWLSPDDQPAGKTKIAWASFSTFRGWKTGTGKSALVQLEAGRKYYVESLHAQGGGSAHLSVGWTLPDGTQERPIPGNRLLPYIDSDSDLLEQWDELNVYHTDPNLADTDFDGLSDEEEVLVSKTNPTEPNAVELVASTPGSAAVIATGPWQVGGEEIVSTSYNGSLDFLAVVATADVYRLRFDLSQVLPQGPATSLVGTISVQVDGERVAAHITAGAGRISAVAYTPWLVPGQHVVRLGWYNVYPGVTLAVKALEVFRVSGPDQDGDGMKDWITVRNLGAHTIDRTLVESAVSPACLEGRGRYLSRMAITAGAQGASVAVQANTNGGWYADIPLDQAGATLVSVRFQDGLETQTHAVTWTVTDVLHTAGRTLRAGDALRLSAFATGEPAEAPVTLTITPAGAAPVVLQTTSGAAVVHVFAAAGTCTVQAVLQKSDGTIAIGSMAVTVLSRTMPAAPILWLDNTRTWTWSGLDGGSVVECSGLRLYEKYRTADGARSYSLRADELESRPVIVARTSAGGPVLGSVRPPVFEARGAVEGFVKVVRVFPDGATMIESTLHLSSVPAGLTVTLSISAGGAVFSDGSLEQNLSSASFDDMGTYTYRVLRPAGNTTTCHSIFMRQAGVDLGNSL